MNKRELKKVIKEMVRESLMEIFAEMQLETIVESVVQKNIALESRQVPRQSMAEIIAPEPEPAENVLSPEEKRRLIMEKIGIDENTWNTVYKDTAESGNAIITGEEKPERVSEGMLRQAGLMKDYSKFVT